jgi:hypothetical protein
MEWIFYCYTLLTDDYDDEMIERKKFYLNKLINERKCEEEKVILLMQRASFYNMAVNQEITTFQLIIVEVEQKNIISRIFP